MRLLCELLLHCRPLLYLGYDDVLCLVDGYELFGGADVGTDYVLGVDGAGDGLVDEAGADDGLVDEALLHDGLVDDLGLLGIESESEHSATVAEAAAARLVVLSSGCTVSGAEQRLSECAVGGCCVGVLLRRTLISWSTYCLLMTSSSCLVGRVSSGSSSNLAGRVLLSSGEVEAKVGKRAPPAEADSASERSRTTTKDGTHGGLEADGGEVEKTNQRQKLRENVMCSRGS